MKTLLFLLVGLTAVGSIACFGISQEAMQSALDEQAAAAQRQADTAAHNHALELADNDAAASARTADVQESLVQAKLQAAGLQDQLDAANSDASATEAQLETAGVEVDNLLALLETNLTEVASLEAQLETAGTEIAGLQDQLAAATKETGAAAAQLNAEVADLKDQLVAAKRETATAKGQTNAERAKTAEARAETRWVWVDPTATDSSPKVYGIPATASDILGLIANCQTERNVLVLWEDSPYETDEYTVTSGFDEERLRPEWTYGFDSFPLLLFTDVDASELWRSKTFTITGSYGSTTWDTAQLHRMFPTEKTFCDGEQPRSN